jgi:hypothetical protein
MEFKWNMNSTRQIIKSKCFGYKRFQSDLQHHSRVLRMVNYKLCDIKVYLDYENEGSWKTFPKNQQCLCNMYKIHWLVVEIVQTPLLTLNTPYFFQTTRQGHTHTHTHTQGCLPKFTHTFTSNCKFHSQHMSIFQISRRQSHRHTHIAASPSFTHNTFHLSKSQENNHMHIIASCSCKFHTHLFPPTYHSCKFHTTHFTFPNHKKTITHTYTPFLATSHSSKFHTQRIYVYLLSKSQDNNWFSIMGVHTHTHSTWRWLLISYKFHTRHIFGILQIIIFKSQQFFYYHWSCIIRSKIITWNLCV